MRRIERNEEIGIFDALALLGAAIALSAALSGCGLMGVRKADLWGAKFEFAEGLDFSFGANAIDRVNNTRGVSRLEDEPKKAIRP